MKGVAVPARSGALRAEPAAQSQAKPPAANAWAHPELAAAYHSLDGLADELTGTARGLLREACRKIELADEFVAKRIQEDAE